MTEEQSILNNIVFKLLLGTVFVLGFECGHCGYLHAGSGSWVDCVSALDNR